MSNLFQRVLVAVIGIPLLLYAVIFQGWSLYFLIIFLQTALLYEWAKLAKARDSRINWFLLFCITVFLDLALYTANSLYWGTALLLIVIMFLSELFVEPRYPLKNLGGGLFYLIYVALPLSLWGVINDLDSAHRFGNLGVLAILMITIWISDSAAYFCGRSFGKHKLFPAVSPNKTIEGAVGGFLFPTLVLPILTYFNFAQPSGLDYFVLPLIVGFFGQLGDLFESMLKREVEIKDSSSIIPGHGGFLDRFDSLLISTPIFYSYLLISH